MRIAEKLPRWLVLPGADPAKWPVDLSTDETVRLAKRFLRREGWEIAEPLPFINVFVRAKRDNVWLNLVIHSQQSLSLPFMLRDCMALQREDGMLVGILSRDRVSDEIAADAERMGVFVISPQELRDAAAHVRKASRRLEELRKAATEILPATSSDDAAPQTPDPVKAVPTARPTPPHDVLLATRRDVFQLLKSHRLAECEAVLTATVETYPTERWAHTDLLRVLQRQRKWTEAIAQAGIVRQSFPDEAAGYIIGSFVLRQMDRAADAQLVMRQAPEAISSTAWYLAEMTSVHESLGNLEQALACSMSALSLEKNENIFRVTLRILRRLNRIDELAAMLADAESQFADADWVLVERGKLELDRRNWDAAIGIAAALRSVAPLLPEGYVIGAQALRASGRFAECLDVCLSGMKSFPNDFRLVMDGARAAGLCKDFAQSTRLWRHARAVLPNSIAGYLEGAMAHDAASEHDEADNILTAAMKVFPRERHIYQRYAELAESRRDWEEADRRWDIALQALPDDHDLALQHATLFSRIADRRSKYRNIELCLERLARLSETAPAFVPAPVTRIRLLRAEGRLGDAETAGVEAVERFPASAEPKMELATTLSCLGRPDEALAFARAAVDQHPGNISAAIVYLELLTEAGKHDMAEAAAAEAKKLFANDLRIHRAFAEVAALRKDFRLACERWVAALKLFPEDMVARRRLTECRLALQSADPDNENPTVASPVHDEIAEPAGSGDVDLANRFESLGGTGMGCEFGLVQRSLGAEPLGLLRWARIGPDQVKAALEARFEGVGTERQTELDTYKVGQFEEYRAMDTRFGLSMHTFLTVKDASPARALKQVTLRLSFLRRKILESLELHDKIYVFKISERRLTDAELEGIFAALQSYGPNWLLYVWLADPAHEAGTVELIRPGLMIGYITGFTMTPDGAERKADTHCWRRICLAAAKLRDSVPAA
jgi:tetratricopeptide (TPR) repeat protein